MFTLCWENKFLIGQSTKIFSVKTGWKKFLKKLLKGNIRRSKFFGGLDATNELENILLVQTIFFSQFASWNRNHNKC